MRNRKSWRIIFVVAIALALPLVSTAIFFANDLYDSFPTKSNLIPRELSLPTAPISSSNASLALSLFNDSQFQSQLDLATSTSLTKNESVRIWQNGQALNSILTLAKNSHRFFFTNVLSLSCDESTGELFETYRSLAKAGVDVRILINKGYALVSRACLKSLESAGVKIRKGAVHASYLVNDQKELSIGAESLNLFSLRSNGHNRRDRDLMLSLKGPAATDAVVSFLRDWNEEGGKVDEPNAQPNLAKGGGSVPTIENWVRGQIEEENRDHLRGESVNEELKSQHPNGLCRFAIQSPNSTRTQITDLWAKMIESAEKSIRLSGVSVDAKSDCDSTSPVARLMCDLQKKSKSGVSVEVITNSVGGGNGELTMLMDEWLASPTLSAFSKTLLRPIKDWDAKRAFESNQALLSPMENWGENAKIKRLEEFVHYKIWWFDRSALWVGSANPDLDSTEKLREAGVLCFNWTQDVY